MTKLVREHVSECMGGWGYGLVRELTKRASSKQVHFE